VDIELKDKEDLSIVFIFENSMAEIETIAIVYDQRIIPKIEDYELFTGATAL